MIVFATKLGGLSVFLNKTLKYIHQNINCFADITVNIFKAVTWFCIFITFRLTLLCYQIKCIYMSFYSAGDVLRFG